MGTHAPRLYHKLPCASVMAHLNGGPPLSAHPISTATIEQFCVWFSEYTERNDRSHSDLKAEIHAAGNRLVRWVVGTGIAIVIALGALDLLG